MKPLKQYTRTGSGVLTTTLRPEDVQPEDVVKLLNDAGFVASRHSNNAFGEGPIDDQSSDYEALTALSKTVDSIWGRYGKTTPATDEEIAWLDSL